jgi:hypothetical protein
MIGRFLERPVEVRVVLHPEPLEERLNKAGRQRFFGYVIYPSEYGQLPLQEQLRMLRAARKEINAELHEVYQAIRSMDSELRQADQDSGPG